MPGWRGAHLARCLILLALCIPRLAARLETWQPPQNKTEWASRTIYQILVDRFDPGEGSRGRCPELESYCGGVWKGVTAQIPYIRDLGFDAVWFSPISEQTIGPTWQYPDGYHGYWPRNLWAVNPAFGSAEDLEEMIDALHAAGMWAMMDVVPNHVGYGGLPGIAVFNRSEYYHDCSPCQIGCGYSNSDDFQIRHCRLSGLPDLDQDHAYVSAQLMEWHRSAYQQWQVDAYRVDAARHVEVGWLRDLVANVTIFTIGEFADSLERIAGRLAAGALDSSLHFPFSEAATAVFTGRVPMAGLTAELHKIKSALQPLGKEALMGTFIENHDSTRFLCQDNDVRHFENAHALLLFAEGIPIVYYGAELGLQGQRDPLWQAKAAGYEQQELYRFMQTLVRARVAYRVWEFPVTPLNISGPGAEHYYAFQRGPLLVLVNNLPRSGVPTSPPSPPRADSPPAASQLQLSGLKPPLQGRWLADVLQADQAAPDRVLVDGAGYLELPVLPDRWPQVYGLPAPGVRLEGMGRFVPATFKHSSMDRATRALIAYWILAGLLALLLFIRLSGGVRQAVMLPAARLAAALTRLTACCIARGRGRGGQQHWAARVGRWAGKKQGQGEGEEADLVPERLELVAAGGGPGGKQGDGGGGGGERKGGEGGTHQVGAAQISVIMREGGVEPRLGGATAAAPAPPSPAAPPHLPNYTPLNMAAAAAAADPPSAPHLPPGVSLAPHLNGTPSPSRPLNATASSTGPYSPPQPAPAPPPGRVGGAAPPPPPPLIVSFSPPQHLEPAGHPADSRPGHRRKRSLFEEAAAVAVAADIAQAGVSALPLGAASGGQQGARLIGGVQPAGQWQAGGQAPQAEQARQGARLALGAAASAPAPQVRPTEARGTATPTDPAPGPPAAASRLARQRPAPLAPLASLSSLTSYLLVGSSPTPHTCSTPGLPPGPPSPQPWATITGSELQPALSGASQGGGGRASGTPPLTPALGRLPSRREIVAPGWVRELRALHQLRSSLGPPLPTPPSTSGTGPRPSASWTLSAAWAPGQEGGQTARSSGGEERGGWVLSPGPAAGGRQQQGGSQAGSWSGQGGQGGLRPVWPSPGGQGALQPWSSTPLGPTAGHRAAASTGSGGGGARERADRAGGAALAAEPCTEPASDSPAPVPISLQRGGQPATPTQPAPSHSAPSPPPTQYTQQLPTVHEQQVEGHGQQVEGASPLTSPHAQIMSGGPGSPPLQQQQGGGGAGSPRPGQGLLQPEGWPAQLSTTWHLGGAAAGGQPLWPQAQPDSCEASLGGGEGRGGGAGGEGGAHQVVVTLPLAAPADQVLHVAMEYSVPHLGLTTQFMYGGLGKVVDLFLREWPGPLGLCCPLYAEAYLDHTLDRAPRFASSPDPDLAFTVVVNKRHLPVELWLLQAGSVTYYFIAADIFRHRTRNTLYQFAEELEMLTWASVMNQAVSVVITTFGAQRVQFHDWHGTLALMYLPHEMRPEVMVITHNAHYNGVFPIPNKLRKTYLYNMFDLDMVVASRFVEHKGAFDMLHAVLMWIKEYQQGVGCVAVSPRYAEQIQDKLSVFWQLRRGSVRGITNALPLGRCLAARVADGSLTFQAALEHKAAAKQAFQQRCGLVTGCPQGGAPGQVYELLVFLGRLTHQKGADIIALAAPHFLKACPQAQLVVVGPVGDITGAEAQAQLMEVAQDFPGRLYAPPGRYFSGEEKELLLAAADWCLVPSRFEPCGLVDLEFGWEGAVMIGHNTGGLGKMPGVYFRVQSSARSHLAAKLGDAVQRALAMGREAKTKLVREALARRFPTQEMMDKYSQAWAAISAACEAERQAADSAAQATAAAQGEQFFSQLWRKHNLQDPEQAAKARSQEQGRGLRLLRRLTGWQMGRHQLSGYLLLLLMAFCSLPGFMVSAFFVHTYIGVTTISGCMLNWDLSSRVFPDTLGTLGVRVLLFYGIYAVMAPVWTLVAMALAPRRYVLLTVWCVLLAALMSHACMVWTVTLFPAILVTAGVAPMGLPLISLNFLGQSLEVAEVGLWFMTLQEASTNLLRFICFLMAALAVTNMPFVAVNGLTVVVAALYVAWFSAPSSLHPAYSQLRLVFSKQWGMMMRIRSFWLTSLVMVCENVALVLMAYATLLRWRLTNLMVLAATSSGMITLSLVANYLLLQLRCSQLHVQHLVLIIASLPGYLVAQQLSVVFADNLWAVIVTVACVQVVYGCRFQLVGLLAFQTLPTRELVAIWQLLTIFVGTVVPFIVLIVGFTSQIDYSNTGNLLIGVGVCEGLRLLAMAGLALVHGKENLSTL